MSEPKNDANLPGFAVPAIPAIPSGPSAPTAAADPSPGIAEADRLIAAALADHVRMPAPARLRDQLAHRHLAPRRPWRAWLPAFALGAASAAAVALLVVRPAAPADVALLDEAVGDHQRIISAPRPLDVETNDMHNVKPWFTGKLDFVPPVNFVGDGEFQLRGGSLAIFQGHKAAAFVYQRRLHTITLLVHADAAARPHTETTSRGFHVISWASGGFGMALVSDVDWDSLHQLEARLGSASGEKE
jgi:anti-sigma factor RsiW